MDQYQGRDKSVIFISFVRSTPSSEPVSVSMIDSLFSFFRIDLLVEGVAGQHWWSQPQSVSCSRVGV